MRERFECPECVKCGNAGVMLTMRQLTEHLDREHACTPHQVGRIIDRIERSTTSKGKGTS